MERAVCDGPDDSNWDSSFFTQLSLEKEPEEEDDQGKEIETSQTIKMYKDANMYIPRTIEQEGHVDEALKLKKSQL